MSRSWTPEADPDGGRAQTEPLAALLAVAVLAFALAIYGAYVTDVLPTTDDRDVADAALEQAYHHVTEDGIHDPDDDATKLDSAIPTVAIPEGRYLYVEILRIDVERGDRITVDQATYAPDGSTVGGDPHPEASVAERPVPVRTDPGNVTGGTLHVEVWQA